MLFVMLLGLALTALVLVVAVLLVQRYLLAPLPYTEPEPIGTTTVPIMQGWLFWLGRRHLRCGRSTRRLALGY